MSSIFSGKTGLRHQYEDLTYTEINPATTATNAIMALSFAHASRMLFLDNSINVDLWIYLVHPESDSNMVANRLFWIEIPSNRVVNYDINQSGISFEPGARMYISKADGAGAATSGKIRISAWG